MNSELYLTEEKSEQAIRAGTGEGNLLLASMQISVQRPIAAVTFSALHPELSGCHAEV